MNEQEFENYIKQTMKTYGTPSRASFEHVLMKLDEEPVTDTASVRYIRKTATSTIINSKIADIMAIWKSKRIVLVPTFLLLIFVGAFSLSSTTNRSSALLRFVEKNEQIEEPEVLDEDEILIDAFDAPGITDLSIIENEI